MKRLIALLSLCALSACIIVEDYAAKWDEAQYDPCLAVFAPRVSEFDLDKEPTAEVVRWLPLAEHSALMLIKEKPENAGGHMYFYKMDGNVLTIFTPNKTTRSRFERDFASPPVRFDEDTVTLAELNDETLAFVREVSQKGEYWEVAESGLYNTAKNEACPQYDFSKDD